MDDHRNRVYSKAKLAEGTNANTFKTTTNIVFYTIKGVMYEKAAADNIAFSSGHTALAANQQCVFGVLLDSSANVTTVQGPIKDVGDDTKVLAWPESNDDDKVLIGGIIVETGATTFTPGSTDLGAANVTDTYVDCDGRPPQSVTLY
jgi:hypothetical protein